MVPSRKLTVPLGVVTADATVAVKMTGADTYVGFGDEINPNVGVPFVTVKVTVSIAVV